ncbi:glycosyltransferase [Leifsonia sp. YIM 134122]|uniref:Glycosyltransferase n=1 Tax=Leifsonia stereocauli TaxID=3134136 RepID=A0ABU9W7M2_9MICO
MKVVFDAYWWTAGPPSLRHVLREIVFAWHENFPDDELILVTRARHPADLGRLAGSATVRTTALWPQALAASRAARAVAESESAELLLTHNYAGRRRSGASAIYLHDVLFATNPEWFTAPERAYFSFMRRWAARADVVFTSSETEAHRIRQHSSAREVVAVGLGLSTELVSGTEEDPDDTLTSGRFLLTVGRLNVRKNLRQTVRAAISSGSISPRTPLVVVGAADGRDEGRAPDIDRAIADGSVVFTGFVSEARLRWLYRNCALFLFLSLGEGFGMPPVEASHFGAPVVVSDLPVFRETLPTRTRFVDPADTARQAALIRDALSPARPGTPWTEEPDVAIRHNWTDSVHRIRERARAGRATVVR